MESANPEPGCRVPGAFPAYLQGMERDLPPEGLQGLVVFPAYLQGMERRFY